MSALPAGYEALEPFVAQWAVKGMAARAALRGSSSHAERQSFYDAAAPLLAGTLAALDTKPLAELGDKEQRLLTLYLAYAHVALAIESQGPDEYKHTPNRNAMIITRAPSDLKAA
jgi:hypothetical protein